MNPLKESYLNKDVNIVVKGDFKYTDSGILDKTHLRFFCKKNMIDLFESTGFSIEKITYNLSPKRNILNLLTFKIFEEFLVVQYLIVARKKKDKNGPQKFIEDLNKIFVKVEK